MSQAGLTNIPSNVAESFVANIGSAAPVGGVLNIVGGTGITTSASGNTLTITNTQTSTLTFQTAGGNAVSSAGAITFTGAGGLSFSGAGSTVTGTLSAIPNASLANSSITINAGTGLTGGGLVSLGGSVTLNASSSGPVVQQVRANSSALITVAANFYGPVPTTANMAFVISATITPKSASNILIFEFYGSAISANPPDYPYIAIFQSGVTNAIFGNDNGVANAQVTFSPKYYGIAGTTSATTYSVYHSSFFGQTFSYNDFNNGIGYVTFIITEVTP